MFLRIPAALLLALVLIYGAFKAWPLVSGPYVRFSELSVADDGTVTLSGRAIHTQTLTMDGGTLLIDPHGNFQKVMTLPHGDALLTFTATDRFGKSRTVEKDIAVP